MMSGLQSVCVQTSKAFCSCHHGKELEGTCLVQSMAVPIEMREQRTAQKMVIKGIQGLLEMRVLMTRQDLGISGASFFDLWMYSVEVMGA